MAERNVKGIVRGSHNQKYIIGCLILQYFNSTVKTQRKQSGISYLVNLLDDSWAGEICELPNSSSTSSDGIRFLGVKGNPATGSWSVVTDRDCCIKDKLVNKKQCNISMLITTTLTYTFSMGSIIAINVRSIYFGTCLYQI